MKKLLSLIAAALLVITVVSGTAVEAKGNNKHVKTVKQIKNFYNKQQNKGQDKKTVKDSVYEGQNGTVVDGVYSSGNYDSIETTLQKLKQDMNSMVLSIKKVKLSKEKINKQIKNFSTKKYKVSQMDNIKSKVEALKAQLIPLDKQEKELTAKLGELIKQFDSISSGITKQQKQQSKWSSTEKGNYKKLLDLLNEIKNLIK